MSGLTKDHSVATVRERSVTSTFSVGDMVDPGTSRTTTTAVPQ